MDNKREPIWNPNNIKSARLSLELTQEELAQELETTQQHVSDWENGKHPRNAWQSLLSHYFAKKGIKSGS